MRSRSMRVAPALVLLLVATACSKSDSPSTGAGGGSSATTSAMELASTDLYVGAPQRVQVGIFNSTPAGGVQLLTSGTIQLTLAPYQGGTGTPISGSARYLGAPGTEADTGTPHLTDPSVGRGVYELDGTFDRPGIWQATGTFTLGGTQQQLTATFPVLAKPRLPAPGQKALKTVNLTMASKVNPQAIDSRAQDGQPIPDPQLHRDTIAGAIAAHRAALVLFATPVYCQSQFCGPSADALERIAETGPKDADYIHVEIWKDFGAHEVNAAAAAWVYRDGDLTEPWLFLIAPNGTIVDRWAPLFDPAQVMAELRKVAG
ncbi:MAG TPA: hypothetical protein VK646_08950 [Actinomycetota bacterium]|nr:hypothetical protein [Actinomycetota bacterium]